MPLFIVALAVFVLTGGLQGSSTTNDPRPNDEDVIVEVGLGGLARTGSQGQTTPRTTSPATSQAQTQRTTPTRAVREPAPAPAPAPAPDPVQLPPLVSTVAAQNIETTRADLRASVSFIGAAYRTSVHLKVSDSRSDLAATDLDRTNSVGVYQSGIVSRKAYGLEPGTTYYFQACLEGGTICGEVVSLTTEPDYERDPYYYRPSASLNQVTEVQSDRVTLTGQYRMNDSTINTSFFVYGLDSRAVGAITRLYNEYDEIDEEGEDLQVVRAGVNRTDSGEHTRTIDDLDRAATYSARYCVAYDDLEQGIVCSSARTFTTRSRDVEAPDFGLTDAFVQGDEVEFTSRLAMGDYLDGHVFLVYGTSLDRIEAVTEARRMDSIYQRGDELQRRTVAIDFDGESSVSMTHKDFLPGAYFYRFCVEYEAEDYRGYEALTITCSNTRPIAINQ